ncbi:hypothetical protein BSG1_04135 [Bacillus sp. SG-1]|nr:hypothetical protein BSG1_04135 [Bacillus sp. SG-1]
MEAAMRSKQRNVGDDYIRNKAALILAVVLFAICVYLFFPYPDY